MSVNITTSFVEQYSANVSLLAQQTGSKLRNAVDVESIRGKSAFFDQIGVTAAQIRTTRHSDTPQIDTPHSRRKVSLDTYEWGDLVDDPDKVKMLIDPTSTYARAAAAAMNRSIDDVIITAFNASASTGVSGGTSTALPSSQKTATSDQSDGLSVDKLRSAKYILDNNDVDPSLKRYLVCGPKQIQDLLALTEVTSSDYNVVRALATGTVDSFLGFQFITSTRLNLDSTYTSDRLVFAFTEDAIKLALGKDVSAKISERADKSYSTQVYYSMDLGATRMQETSVVQIPCHE